MKTPSELTREQLVDIVGEIQQILWQDPLTGAFDPDRSWDSATIEWISGALEDAGLKPQTVIPNDRVSPARESQAAQPDGSLPGSNPQPADDAVRTALDDFIATIEATGGCFPDDKGVLAPVGDPDWIDLADAYVRACTAIDRAPLIVASTDTEEV